MTVDPTNVSPTAGLVDRAKNILLTPKAEWARIATETPNTNKLFVGYALPLIGLAAICAFIGATMIGSFFGRSPMMLALVAAIFQVAIGLGSLFLMSVIANALAPSFGSRQDTGRAQQLVVYGSTPNMVAGILAIFPPLGMIAMLIGGLYSIVLVYFGLPAVMNTPADKQVVYLVVLVIANAVIFWILAWIVGIIMLSIGFGALGAAANMNGY